MNNKETICTEMKGGNKWAYFKAGIVVGMIIAFVLDYILYLMILK